MSKKIRQILRRIALCAVLGLAFCTVAESAFASGKQDVSDDGGSGDGWQTLAAQGDQVAGPVAVEPQPVGHGDAQPLPGDTSAVSKLGPQKTATQLDATSPAVVVGAPMPTEAPAKTFDLVAGESLEMQMQTWAHRANWTLDWQLQDDWVVPGNSTYGNNFEQSAIEVVEQAAKNGADIRWDSYEGNHTFVVHQAGAM
jgi:hypothetical protein